MSDADPARRIGLFLALGGLMVVLDTTVAVVAMPRLVAEFDTGLSTVQWVTAGYALALVAVMPTAAFAISRLGGRTTYLLAAGLFTVGSLLAGFAWDIGSLIGFRVLQGLGGGLLNPVGMAIALAAVPPGRRGRMMSLVGLPVLVGPLIGPVLGGVLVDYASWRWIFWITVPVGVTAVLIGRRVLPATTGVRARLDVPGLFLLCPGITLAVLGLTVAGERGEITAPAAIGPILAGTAMVAAFVLRALRIDHPLLRVRVLRHRSMAAGAGTLALFAAAYFGSMLIAPVYVQIVRGDGATLAGLIGIPQALATGLSLQVATRLTDRIPARSVVRAGVAITLVGMVLLAVVLAADTPYPVFMAAGVVIGLGAGAAILPTITTATLPVSGPEMPSATTLLNICSQSAVASGTAAVAAVLSIGTRAAGLDGLAATHGPALTGAIRLTLLVPIVLLAAALVVTAWLRQPVRQPAYAALRPLTDARAHRPHHN